MRSPDPSTNELNVAARYLNDLVVAGFSTSLSHAALPLAVLRRRDCQIST